MTIHNVIILIKSVVNENKNHYYYNVFLKVHIKINPMHNIFKWMFAYYKCYISIELKFLKELNTISESKECSVCHYWYFLNKGFTFQRNVCNRYHDLLMISMNLSNIAILKIKGSDYCCIISWVSKNKAI